MKITVFGAGNYGIAIAMMLAKKKENEVLIWTENKNTFDEFMKTHKFTSKFPDLDIPNNISITMDNKKALEDAGLIFLITASKYTYSLCKDLKKYYNGTPICIASKGLDDKTLKPLSYIVENTLNTKNVTVISGPTFAVDLVRNHPAALAIAGNNKVIKLVKDNLANESLKLRKSSDILGIQLCGSVKNIIAIAAGILKGLGYSETTQAFLINESLHDMKNILASLGAKKRTILSFAGVGDLILTCSSEKSRNYSFGYVIGSTKDKKKIGEYLSNNTVEGYNALKYVYTILNKKRKKIPLVNVIYDIIYNNEDPNTLAEFLINKD